MYFGKYRSPDATQKKEFKSLAFDLPLSNKMRNMHIGPVRHYATHNDQPDKKKFV